MRNGAKLYKSTLKTKSWHKYFQQTSKLDVNETKLKVYYTARRQKRQKVAISI